MFTFMRQASAGAVSPPPMFIGSADCGASVDLAVPAHQAGDLLLLIETGVGGGGFTPAARGGYTTPTNGTWGLDPVMQINKRYQWIVDTLNTINTITIGTFTKAVVLVYRNASAGVVAVGTFSTNLSGELSWPVPALASSAPGGSVMISVVSAGNQPIDSITTSSSLIYTQSAIGGDSVKVISSDTLVSSAPSATGFSLANTLWAGQTIELLPAP